MKSLVDVSAAAPEGETTDTGWADFSTPASFVQPPVSDNIDPSALNPTATATCKQGCKDYDDWQDFNETETRPHKLSNLSKQVMTACFETRSEGGGGEVGSFKLISLDHRLCRRRAATSVFDSSCSLIQFALHKAIFSESSGKLRQLHLDLPAECNSFDWDKDSTPNRDSISPILFRPGPQESPIDVHFDHERATLGLAILSEAELETMSEEMEKKFNHMSELLVLDLQTRDKFVTELSIKNKFISALLRVKTLKHSSSTTSGLDGVGRPRTKSLRISRATADERVNSKYLSSIIPYCPPEGNSWSINTLSSLIEILNAIADDSEDVPTLIADYLTKEVLR